MKKRLLLIIILISMVMLPVKAIEHIPGELIPVSEEASIDTETIKYQGITFSNKGSYGVFDIKSVQNKTNKQIPMSVNLLIFDTNKVNIGFVSYCTDKDVESDYSNAKLNSNQTKHLAIKVNTKYFAEGKTSADVAFYSLLDENPYCQIGGYNKYSGFTIEEILNGKTPTPSDSSTSKADYSKVLKYVPLIVGVVVVIAVLSFVIKLIKKSSKEKMVNNDSPSEKKEKIIPERKRKKKVKEEELVEDESVDVAPTNPGEEIVDLKFDSNTDSLSNDSGLLMDNSNSLSEESLVEDNNEPTPSVDNPTSEETTPPVNNDNGESELMDLFK